MHYQYHANVLIEKIIHDILDNTNPMRDAMIEFLKATLSTGFRTKKLHFSCIKTTTNSKIIISLQILPILYLLKILELQ